jgi:hypothetical protein
VTQLVSISDKLAEWERQRGIRTPHRVAVYVSVPITTGRAFTDWFRAQGYELKPGSDEYKTALRANVVLPNVQHAAAFIELLRWHNAGFIVDPTALDVPGWGQAEYNEFWCKIIERHVRRVVFLDGWEHSNGCTLEFETAQALTLECVDEKFQPISRERGLELICAAIAERKQLGLDSPHLERVARELRNKVPVAIAMPERRLYKDEVLDHLAQTANVAQFISFAPGDLRQRYCRVHGYSPNHIFSTPLEAVAALISRSPEGLVNIRTFDPRRPEGNPFVRRLGNPAEVIDQLQSLGKQRGLHTIVNETIDESDGGVSGVAYRGLVEFAPDTTPRCVDDVEVETTTLPFHLGIKLLSAVYGFEPDLRGREGSRVEFSVHPAPRGWMRDHTVIWQVEQRPAPELEASIEWPNAFSRMLGDKAFGLGVATVAGLRVPRSVVFTRRLMPFQFGESTGTNTRWTRTCPAEKAPGFYPTVRGWFDPIAVLKDWRILGGPVPSIGQEGVPPLASVLIQEAVSAQYSGRAVITKGRSSAIAGVAGEGDAFMVGAAGATELPPEVLCSVRDAHRQACDLLGPVDLEWVFDGTLVWIVQVSKTAIRAHEGEHEPHLAWVEFQYGTGRLEEYRSLVTSLAGRNTGVRVVGNVSPLSHVGEIAELAGVPVKFVRED